MQLFDFHRGDARPRITSAPISADAMFWVACTPYFLESSTKIVIGAGDRPGQVIGRSEGFHRGGLSGDGCRQ